MGLGRERLNGQQPSEGVRVTSIRKQRARVQRLQQAMCRRRASAREAGLLDRSPAVGREFGSPDFERLMEEDHRLGQGVFDPAVRHAVETFARRVSRDER